MSGQLSFIDALFAKEPSKKKALCESWQCAVKNENGAFWKNVHSFPMGSFKNYFLELSLALNYPYVFGEVRIQCGHPHYYGKCSPIVGDGDLIQFNVFDDAWNVECELTTKMNAAIADDENLEDKDIEPLMRLVNPVVVKAMNSIKNEKE